MDDPNPVSESELESLRGCFEGPMFTDDQEVAPFLIDWRRQWVGRSAAVVQPNSVDGVASIVRWCQSHQVAVVPQGGNTGLSGGATPDQSGRSVVLSLVRLNQIRAIDPVNNTITVDAGCTLEEVQVAASMAGRYFPLSLAAGGTCTIGGNLATNAGGTGVLRFGNARDLCVGLEVVTAAGEIWKGLRGLRKDNTGYDLKDVFIGSEGTLGVITAAVLKLFPRPDKVLCGVLAVPSVEAAVQALGVAQDVCGHTLTGFELFSDACVELVHRHTSKVRNPVSTSSPWFVLIELQLPKGHSDTILEQVIEQLVEQGLVSDAAVASSQQQVQAFWALRENISEAQGAQGPTVKHDVSVPISSIAEFVADALEQCGRLFPHALPVVFGHLGDGNLHFNFSVPETSDPCAAQQLLSELNRVVHDAVRARHGSISAEHGLGVLRRDEAARDRDPVETQLMLAIKGALDPAGIMNPGKVLPLG
jgi:FAD/FMN-containing dehydrogenase